MEQAILDHESEEIHLAHLEAAAYELPLTPEDEDVFGAALGGRSRGGSSSRGACASAAGATCRAVRAIPPAAIALRSASPNQVAIVEAEEGEVIGTVESARACSTVHPGAVYLHMGTPYEVEELDLRDQRARRAPLLGRLVHAAQERVRDLDRGGPRPAR